ncbi:MAG: YceI family protein [Elusimicrobia bacterium]|nr:YceI family protein [Elusimicrobiota bacterium]MDE2237524.1 YceI family protein [Elusimicrobiota bacterium]MDE2425981.1 YceI family protein [Elusimicrobiota bacterium]
MGIRAGIWLPLGLSLALLPGLARAERYEIDPQHSAVSFRVKHLVISEVNGHFSRFSGSIDYEKGKPSAWGAQAKIDAASIDTGVAARDKHLRSADFLDVEKFPEVVFESRRAALGKDGSGTLYGELTIRGVSRPVALALEVGGTVKDPWGHERLGASATTKIDRRDFGLVWNKVLESGGVMVGDEVQIRIDVEAVAAGKGARAP